jgi:hypothetical protein
MRPPLSLDQRARDVQPQPGTGLLPLQLDPHPHKTAEDLPPQPLGGIPHPLSAILDNHLSIGELPAGDRPPPARPPRTSSRCPTSCGRSASDRSERAHTRASPSRERDHFRRETIRWHTRIRHTGATVRQVDLFGLAPQTPRLQAARIQDLIDQMIQPFDVLQHEPVEVRTLLARSLAGDPASARYSFIDAIGDFNSWVTASMKFDCWRVKLIALTDRIKYRITPTSSTTMNKSPDRQQPPKPPCKTVRSSRAEDRQQSPNRRSDIASRVIITIARVIARLLDAIDCLRLLSSFKSFARSANAKATHRIGGITPIGIVPRVMPIRQKPAMGDTPLVLTAFIVDPPSSHRKLLPKFYTLSTH